MSASHEQGALDASRAARVCHEEQMVIWSSEVAESLAMGGWLREHLSYEDKLDFYADLSHRIRDIVETAFALATPRTDNDEGTADTGTEWFWRIVDANGLGNVPSDEGEALRLLCTKAARYDEMRSAPATPPGVPDSVREAVARLVNPTAFGTDPQAYGIPDDTDPRWKRTFTYGARLYAYERADEIIALISAHPAGQSTGLGAEDVRDLRTMLRSALNRIAELEAAQPAPDSTRTGPVGTEHAQIIRDLMDFHDALNGGVGNGAITIRCESETEQTRRNFRAVLREAAAALAARPAAPEAQGAERVRQALQQIVDEWDENGVLSLKAYRAAEAALAAAGDPDMPPASSGRGER